MASEKTEHARTICDKRCALPASWLTDTRRNNRADQEFRFASATKVPLAAKNLTDRERPEKTLETRPHRQGLSWRAVNERALYPPRVSRIL